jgi:cell division protein FtsN
MNHKPALRDRQMSQILRYCGTVLYFSALLAFNPDRSVVSAPLPPPPNTEQRKPPQPTSTTQNYLYRVWVPGVNPWVLNRVRSIEPGAFVRRSQNAIQAGLFTDQNRAKARITQLTSLGFKGRVTALPLFKGSSSTKLPQPAPVSTSTNSNRISVINRNLKLVPHSKYYFVVVPGGDAELATVEARLVGSGIEQQAVLIRDQPLGYHVALGPFEERQQAESWSKYLRKKGMDARVYFDR